MLEWRVDKRLPTDTKS